MVRADRGSYLVYNREMTPDQVVSQFQQILSTLQRMIAASAQISDRVDVLEQGSGEILGKLTEVQGHLQILVETYQSHAQAQRDLNERLAESVAALEARLAAIEHR